MVAKQQLTNTRTPFRGRVKNVVKGNRSPGFYSRKYGISTLVPTLSVVIGSCSYCYGMRHVRLIHVHVLVAVAVNHQEWLATVCLTCTHTRVHMHSLSCTYGRSMDSMKVGTSSKQTVAVAASSSQLVSKAGNTCPVSLVQINVHVCTGYTRVHACMRRALTARRGRHVASR